MTSAPELDSLSVAARAFVDGDAALLPGALTSDDTERLVAYLVAAGDGERLARLAEAPDKAVAKGARRGLHLLRTRGAPAPAPRPHAFVVGPYAPDEPAVPSLATLIDGRGERVVWLVRPASDGGLEVFQAELSESRGLEGFAVAHVGRREWRTRLESMTSQRSGAGKLPSAHVRGLIERAYRRSLEAGRALPESFARAKLDLGPAEPPPARHLAYARVEPLPLDEARPLLAGLHERLEVMSWLPSEAAMGALDLEVGEVMTSKLIVSPEQRAEQVAAAVERVADRTVEPEDRERLAERLEESALLVSSDADARLMLAAAALTRDASVPPSANPFLRRLYEKLLEPATPEPETGRLHQRGPTSPLSLKEEP